MPRVAAGGMKFYYQQIGHGPDVVLLHGVTGNMAIWPLTGMMDTLAADFRVTAYDLRGHGYSDTPPSGYTSADMVGDLMNIKAALSLGPMYVLGHSFGGVVAQHAAVLHPEAVAGVILSDPFFPGLRHLEINSFATWVGWEDHKAQCNRAGLTITSEDWFDLGKLYDQTAHLTPEKQEMFKKEIGAAGMARMSRLAGTTCGEDGKAVAGLTAERIVSVQQPVLALYGEHSPFLATCRYLHDHLPNCRVALVPGAKHRGHEENPAVYVELVQKHLREMAGVSGTWKVDKAVPAGGAA